VSEAATYAACLTPPGTAALATLAIRGPQAWSIARSLFQPRGKATPLPDEPQPGQIWLGRFGAEAADDVVLSVKPSGPTFGVEISCHGGAEVIRLLLDLLKERGAQLCSWPDLEGLSREDPLNALALAALSEAKTTRTAAILLDQLHGAFARAIDEILACLQRGQLDEAGAKLEELNRNATVGRHLMTPWRVTIAGAPNVGKSSLLNAIAGYQRCIVSPTPGTTRDVVTAVVAIDGWPIELADTAGLRSGEGALEAEGMQHARAALGRADLCLWVIDGSSVPAWPDSRIERLRIVVNKIDLPSAWDLSEAGDAHRVSVRTGAGVAELCEDVAHWLVPNPPATGGAVPFTEELCTAIAEACTQLKAGDVPTAMQLLVAIRHPSHRLVATG
jgi:tRNA modification GTPase